MGSIIGMYGAGTGGTENGVAQIDIPMSGMLQGVQVSHSADLDADNDYSTVELSFRSAGAFTVNDDRGVLYRNKLQITLTTSGLSLVSNNLYVPLPDIPIAAGERLFMHLTTAASIISTVTMLLSFSFDIDKVASRRRG